jgi:LytS/YehU family sensor histidine kinase
MLATLRRLYERDVVQAERFLDELIDFLRAALPRLRTAWSSLSREVELSRSFVRLQALAAESAFDITLDLAPEALHARFPPGVLLPLLNAAAGSGTGPCRLSATRAGEGCRVVLALEAAPADAAVAHVRSLLIELYGTAGTLAIEKEAGAVNVIVEVPYELA